MKKHEEIKTVMVILNRSMGYYRSLLRGIFQYSMLHGHWRACGDQWREYSALTRMPTFDQRGIWQPDGVITCIRDDLKTIKKFIPIQTPIIVLPEKKKFMNVPNVITDDVAIGKMAAEHLLSIGLKSFGYCGFDDMFWSRGRGESFGKIIEKSGFKTNFYTQPKSKIKRLYKNEQVFIMYWLKSLPKPVGIMACDDDRSQHVIEAAKAAGLYVPDDVAVIGVDNDDLLCEPSVPPITSIALNTKRAGYEAAELLDKMMAGTEKMGNQIIKVLPTHIITRQSTNIQSIEDDDVKQALYFIQEHARKIIRVSDVTEAIGVSRRVLEKRFRKIVGHTVLEEIRQVRIELISQMLVETNLSISKIAVSFGFSDISNMVRYFKAKKGLTPLNYRKKYGKK